MRATTAAYIELHELELSTAQIAAQFGVKKNSVIAALRYNGALHRAPGRDIEDAVAIWTIGKARSCFKMRGDRPFDLLIDGVRVDVKSAGISIMTPGRSPRYYFALTHKDRVHAKVDAVDAYYLVIKDKPGRPIYKLAANAVDVKSTMSLPQSITGGKYSVEFVGHLDHTETPSIKHTERQVMPLTN